MEFDNSEFSINNLAAKNEIKNRASSVNSELQLDAVRYYHSKIQSI